MSNPYGYIYRTTNLIDGMVYVGQHKATKFDSGYLGGGTYFRKALKVYGKENFKSEILDWAKNYQELNDKEAFWIDYLNLVDSPMSYNLVPGGGGNHNIAGKNNPMYGRGYKIAGERNGMWGKHHTEKVKHKLSLLAKEKTGEKNPFYGKHHSDETKAKIRMYHLGKHHSEEWKAQASKDRTGKRWVHDNWGCERWVYSEEVDTYVGIGWKLGRLPKIVRDKFIYKRGKPNMETLTIKIKYHEDKYGKLTKLYKNPKGDWIDLYAAETVKMKQGEFKLISLGISMQFPEGYEAHMATRSSTYKTWGILLANSHSIIDSSYCGDNDIWLFPALAMRDTVINKGDKIAQFRLVSKMKDVTLEVVTQLGNPDRGGLGSTGVK